MRSKWYLGSVFLFCIANQVNAESITTENGIGFEYRVHDAMMDITVKCDTTGWVGVGFDPTDQMKDANYILGYVDQDKIVHLRDDFGTDLTKHKADTVLGGVDNITNGAGTEDSGMTQLSFTIPLDSGDAYDRPLTLGSKHTVILACGLDGFDNFVAKHKKFAKFEIQL